MAEMSLEERKRFNFLLSNYVLFAIGYLDDEKVDRLNDDYEGWHELVETEIRMNMEDVCQIWRLLCEKWPPQRALGFLLRGFDCLAECELIEHTDQNS